MNNKLTTITCSIDHDFPKFNFTGLEQLNVLKLLKQLKNSASGLSSIPFKFLNLDLHTFSKIITQIINLSFKSVMPGKKLLYYQFINLVKKQI